MLAKKVWLGASAAALVLAACGQRVETKNGETAPAAAEVTVNEGEPVDGEVTLSVPATAMAGTEIALAFTGPANARDYIDIVPRGYEQTSGELAYIYVPAAVAGGMLRVVTAPGEYDVRYVLDLNGARSVKAAQPLTVTAAEATLDAPASASGGETLSVAWTGPAGQGDYIDLVRKGHGATSGEITYAYAASGNPASLNAPGAAGDYELRYILEGPGGRRVLASSPLAVALPEAQLTAPEAASPGERVIVEYEGPMRSGDYVDLVRRGYIATSGEMAYFYADGRSANELVMPDEAGEYDIRYVMEAPGGRAVLAKQTIRVE
ncbi:MAG: hypothetical protein CVT79_16405 [Alphaproteobacteria bacterium HGW-Alphaproteobacteria-18]|nr:MAG: hypothetical protein CVT79_16405 [Alphaproteobacteria bacterium HGW-Alphaproteobacteria-18]